MRPPARLIKPLETPSLRYSKKALYVCSNCRYDVSVNQQQPQHQTRRHASGSGSTPFTEKLRRRIWGTDNPPGLKDPYGGEGVIEREWKKRKAQYVAEGTQQQQDQLESRQQDSELLEEVDEKNFLPEEEELPAELVPAMTAHNLPRMGFLGEWHDFPPTENDKYYSFVSHEKAKTSAQFRTAAQSVAVELGILHELKKPLSLACDIPRHHESIWEMIEQCQIKESSNATSLDNIIEFPSAEVKENLFFVFNQLGEIPDSQPEEAEIVAEEVAAQPEIEAAELKANEIEEFEEAELGVQEDVDVEDEPVVYSYALDAEMAPTHAGYLNLSLADPAIKFAFLKRFAQVTGHFIQDNSANSAQTVKDIIEHIEKIVCRPKKLAEQLAALKAEQDIPNLQIIPKRYTKADHDREVGRRKVIEQALRERGLISDEVREDKFRL